MTLYKWSQTAATNGNADSTCPFPEGMAASALNDGTRGMMAAVAKYRDDTSGSLGASSGTGSVGGTSSAYTVSSNQGFDTLAHLRLSEITFVCPATNAAGVTLNVDSTGAQAINGTDGNPIPAGTMLQGGVYTVTAYTGEFILHHVFGNPYNIPLAGGMQYFGTTVPNSSFAFPIGQAISRTTYSALFALTGTTYGSGDGSTTFNLPDMTGRVAVMKENTATRLTSTYFGGNSTVLGATGGGESHLLTTAEIPSHTHANTLTDPGHTHGFNPSARQFGSAGTGGGLLTIQVNNGNDGSFVIAPATTGITINNAAQGGGGAHAIVQPTIVCNYIMRII